MVLHAGVANMERQNARINLIILYWNCPINWFLNMDGCGIRDTRTCVSICMCMCKCIFHSSVHSDNLGVVSPQITELVPISCFLNTLFHYKEPDVFARRTDTSTEAEKAQNTLMCPKARKEDLRREVVHLLP